jgi:AcrR family transcriptional regulator
MVLAAAARVFRRRGYAGSTVTHVVKEAKVSRGTFYGHFDSKRRLLAALAGDLLDRILPRFPAAPSLSTREDLASALAEMNRRAFSSVAREPDTARLVLGGGIGSEPSAVRLLGVHDAAWKRLTHTLLQRARAAKLLREGVELPAAVELIVGSSQRIVRAIALGTASPSIEALAVRLADMQTAAVAR